MSNQSSYPYAVGSVRGLERSLLPQALFHRLEEQPFAMAVKALADSGYGTGALHPDDPESLCDAEVDRAYRDVGQIAPEPKLIDLFRLEEDALNLKLFLKARLLGTPPGEGAKNGRFPAALLQEAVEKGDYRALPAALAEPLTALEKEIRAEQAVGKIEPLQISASVDQAIYAFLLKEAASTKSGWLLRLFQLRIDFTNLLTLLRVRALGWNKEHLKQLFIAGGTLKESELLRMMEMPAEKLRSARFGEAGKWIRPALDHYLEGGLSVPAAERSLQKALFSLGIAARGDSFGVGPLVAYLLKKKREARQLRILFANKRAEGR